MLRKRNLDDPRNEAKWQQCHPASVSESSKMRKTWGDWIAMSACFTRGA